MPEIGVGAAAWKHLVLVGLPGAGKSVVGRRVAQRVQRSFIDLDDELERRAGQSVAAIFARYGEAYFRAREAELSAELAGLAGMVLAPGGGWMANVDAERCLRPVACVVYLRVSAETALRRMGTRWDRRPLLRSADPLASMRALLVRRAVVYEGADRVIDTEGMTVQQVTAAVASLAPQLAWG